VPDLTPTAQRKLTDREMARIGEIVRSANLSPE
jgi:hypothetical protein